MVVFISIFFFLVLLNTAVISYSFVASMVKSGSRKTQSVLQDATKILPLDLNPSNLKKAI